MSHLSSDFSCIARDITIDLNGYTLAADDEVDWFEGEFIKIELQYGRSFKLQNGTVTGAKSKAPSGSPPSIRSFVSHLRLAHQR